MEQYSRCLQGLCNLKLDEVKVSGTPGFVYAFNEDDRSYGPPEYSESGVFNKVTNPWLNDFKTIPADMQWTEQDQVLMAKRGEQVVANKAYAREHVPGQTYTGDIVEQIRQRYTKELFDTQLPFPTVPAMEEHWLGDDQEFVRQRMGLNNPDVFRKYAGSVDALRDSIKQEDGGLDIPALQQALVTAAENGTLFMSDYRSVLGNVTQIRQGQFFAVPISYYILDKASASLSPAAIQLNEGSYWFTPQDSIASWLLAKLHVASADTQWWFSGTHLFNTHSIDAIFGIAAMNISMPETHPIYEFIKPNIKKVFSINSGVYAATPSDDGSIALYNKGGGVDSFLPTGRIGLYEIINALYKDYSFDAQSFPELMQARGIDNTSLAVDFPYRDDGSQWWQAISTFVSEMVDAIYADDKAVADDTMLNDWLGVVTDAFNHDGTVRFTPFDQTRSRLKEILSNLYFLTTVQHTAVNNTMFDGMAMVANGAFAMTAEAPANASTVSDETVLASLPDPQTQAGLETVLGQIEFVMNGTATVDYTVETIPYDYPAGTPQADAVTRFQASLDTLKGEIAARREQRVNAFKAANPSAQTVPNTVTYDYLDVASVMACIQI